MKDVRTITIKNSDEELIDIEVVLFRLMSDYDHYPTVFYIDGTAFSSRNEEYTKKQEAMCDGISDDFTLGQVIYIKYPVTHYQKTIDSCVKIIFHILNESFSVDQDNVFLLGYSSGGALAVWSALKLKKENDISFRTITLISPTMNTGPSGKFFDERSGLFEPSSINHLMDCFPKLYDSFFQHELKKNEWEKLTNLGLTQEDVDKYLPKLIIMFGRNDFIRHQIYKALPLFSLKNPTNDVNINSFFNIGDTKNEVSSNFCHNITQDIESISTQINLSLMSFKQCSDKDSRSENEGELEILLNNLLQLYYGQEAIEQLDVNKLQLIPIPFSGHDSNCVVVRHVESINTRRLIAYLFSDLIGHRSKERDEERSLSKTS